MDNGLDGIIPPDIAILSNSLSTIVLKEPDISGSIPEDLYVLTNLKFMLGSSGVSGSVASEIGQLTKLSELRLSDNDLVGTIPGEIGLLTDLETLVISGEVINGRIPSELGLLSLTDLRLHNTLLSGSIPSFICTQDANVLVDCERVECTCCGCPPTPAPSFSVVPTSVLSKTYRPTTNPTLNPTQNPTFQPTNNPTEGPTTSASPTINRDRLVVLVSQHLPSTSFANSSSPQSLALEWFQSDDSATSVQLSDNRLLQRFALATAFISFGREASLEQADECGWRGDWFEMDCNSRSGIAFFVLVRHNYVRGTISPELSLLTALTTLGFAFNSLTGSIPPQLSTLTALGYLDASDNDLTGPIPPQLSTLSKLTWLGVKNNDLTGTIPPQLSSLTALTMLDLANNDLTGPIPPLLSTLTALTRLDFRRNQLRETIPTHLAALTLLRILILSFNQLTGTVPSQLSDLTLLEFPWLHSDQLTGTVPSALCANGIPPGNHDFQVDRAEVECACCSCCG